MSFFLPTIQSKAASHARPPSLAWGASVPGIGFIGGTHRRDTKDVFEVAPARASHLPENASPTATIAAGRPRPSWASRLGHSTPPK